MIEVDIDRGPRIAFGDNIFDELNEIVAQRIHEGRKVFVLVDENTYTHCYPILLNKADSLAKAEILEIDSGETNKDIQVVIQLWKALIELDATRRALFINLGGGVIMDMGGFTASAYKRGIDFIHIPTTLLGMADACIGGKTGVDLENFKNTIGLIKQPIAIFISPGFLASLSARELKSGFAEIIKHSVISQPEFFTTIKTLTPAKQIDWEKMILQSIKAKKAFTDHDPYEINVRKALNFGHTFGHAIESWSLDHEKDHLLHGESVAAGLIIESYISHKAFGLKKTEFDAVKALVCKWFKPHKFPETAFSEIVNYMLQDKKNETDSINFTFIAKIGEFLINQNATSDLMKEAWDYYQEI
ncbi:MAG: 3-dehydroquinate synthase [Bacteroidetes bacterium]|nr:3-dehydroquinate synthase [Bacteroidota bacterium]MBU1719655.1 3-dehydroquinate synthase [Bacteroidota bacterium]